MPNAAVDLPLPSPVLTINAGQAGVAACSGRRRERRLGIPLVTRSSCRMGCLGTGPVSNSCNRWGRRVSAADLGLPDDDFLSDGLLTKRVLRASALAALAPVGNSLWDLGAGTGSIGIEWCRRSRTTTGRSPWSETPSGWSGSAPTPPGTIRIILYFVQLY